MKKLIPLLFSLLCAHPSGLRAQASLSNLQGFDARPLRWGFYVGLNYFDFSQSPTRKGVTSDLGNRLQSKPYEGFSVGLIGDLRLYRNLSLRFTPAIHYTKRALTFRGIGSGHVTYNLKSNYLDLPLLLKLNSDRWHNLRPYLSGGFGLAYNTNAHEQVDQQKDPQKFPLRRLNYDYQFEFGVEIYFSYFKLTPAIKGIFMLNDEMVPDGKRYMSAISDQLSYLKTSAVLFSLKFE